MGKINPRIFYNVGEINTLREEVKKAYTEATKTSKNPLGGVFQATTYRDNSTIEILVVLLKKHCSNFKRGNSLAVLSSSALIQFFTKPSKFKNEREGFSFEKRTFDVLNEFVGSFPLPQAYQEPKTTITVKDQENNNEILAFGKCLRFLYNTDEITIGVEEANSGYAKFKFKLCPYPSIIRDLFRFNMRVKDRGKVREIAKELINENYSDEVLIHCQLSLFECELREALSDLKIDRLAQVRKIREAKSTYFDKIPSSQHNNKDYWYWLGRWYFDLWYATECSNDDDLMLSLTYFEKSLVSQYTWFVHCYKCIVIKLLDRNDFKAERKKYTDTIIQEKIEQPKKPSVQTFRIASFVLNEDMPGLKGFLKKHNVPSSANDFQSTIFHFIELIFREDKNEQEKYKHELRIWRNNLPVK